MSSMRQIQRAAKKKLKILRIKQVVEKTKLSRAHIYCSIKLGNFPRQIPLGDRAVGWIEGEVENWLESRIALRSEEEI